MNRLVIIFVIFLLTGCIKEIKDGVEMTVAIKREKSPGIYIYYLDTNGEQEMVRTTYMTTEVYNEGDIIEIRYIKK